MHPYRGNSTLKQHAHSHLCAHRHAHSHLCARRHRERLPTAAGISEWQKCPIFSPFHLNNKQGIVLKLAWEESKEIGLIRVILNQKERKRVHYLVGSSNALLIVIVIFYIFNDNTNNQTQKK